MVVGRGNRRFVVSRSKREQMIHDERADKVRNVAFLGNSLPRKCGIATFTTDLVNALGAPDLGLECGIVAMNDGEQRYAYDERVVFEISEDVLSSYRRAADFLNVGGFDAVCLQHEYGIFGGRAGAHLLSILEELRLPIITTLHTILGDPSADQKQVMDRILRLSTRVVVMSKAGASILKEVHGVSPGNIDLIPHGISQLPDRQASREKLRLDDSLQLLTFGLLSPDKGLEYVIEALPAVLEQFPNAVYVIVGATHPKVKESQGEAYRLELQLRAHKLGVEEHIVFHDRFVSSRELGEFLSSADVYLTPYLNPEQITSGTLAYAVGTGKAVVSTPYRYAEELLADGRGILVPYRDSPSIAQALCRLLSSSEERGGLSSPDAAVDLTMTWPSVAARYKASFELAYGQFAARRRTHGHMGPWKAPQVELPELDLRHVKTLTDDTGILQHAIFSVPRYEDGYCIDDNARALLLATLVEEVGASDRATTRALSTRYLAFVSHAFNSKTMRFRNFMDYCRSFNEDIGSEDSHGRALWALGAVVGRAHEPGRTSLAGQLFHDALPPLREFTSPRALAFGLLGIRDYLKAFSGDREVEGLQRTLARHLLSRFPRSFDGVWPWCEDGLTYDNARIPQALIASGRALGDEELVHAGVSALQWLAKIQTSDNGNFSPVGSNGFFRRGESRAQFDQQPLEACASVSACLDAWHATGDERWAREMWHVFSWYLGENDVNTPLYDPITGGCRDGLHTDRANENQGAESTLSFLLALVDMRHLMEGIRLRAEGDKLESVNPPEMPRA